MISKLTSHFLHDALLVVVPQGPAELVVVHGGAVLLDAPAPGDLIKDNGAKSGARKVFKIQDEDRALSLIRYEI